MHTRADAGDGQSHRPFTFFVLVLLLSIPFWFLGAASGSELLPRLPIAAFMVVCPAAAALYLSYRENGVAGACALLKRSADVAHIPSWIWYLPAVLLMPAIMLVSYAVMRLLGWPLPTEDLSWREVPALLAVFLVGALCEEMGWSGYAIDPLQARLGALGASLTLGAVWAAWHIVPLIEARRSGVWIAWWCLSTVAARVLIVWLYNNAGRSVFVATLCHATQNLSWMLFPSHGSHYDPRTTGPITIIAALAMVLISGPRTLTGRERGQ